jgi:hypothetical protein
LTERRAEPAAPRPARPALGPLHPVTRLERAIQQVRSFAEMHAGELDRLAAEAEAAGLPELAAHLRVYRTLHTEESQLVLDELSDIRAEVEADARAAETAERTGAAPSAFPSRLA